MKQYTDESQTAKLIELGFKKPKTCLGVGTKEEAGDLELGYIWAYSIGELLSFLPKEIECSSLQLYHAGLWSVSYPLHEDKYYVASSELCDALFKMICYLKDKGVI